MKSALHALLLLAAASQTLAQSCSFTKDFGSGQVLNSAGTEGFQAASGSQTTCSLSCGGGANGGIFLYLRWGGDAR